MLLMEKVIKTDLINSEKFSLFDYILNQKGQNLNIRDPS